MKKIVGVDDRIVVSVHQLLICALMQFNRLADRLEYFELLRVFGVVRGAVAASLMENDEDSFFCRRSNALIECIQQHFVVAAAIPLARSVVGLVGAGSLFGLGAVRLSRLVEEVEPAIRGRLVVFFPGERDGNNYRLLDARDGWSYLALAIDETERD